MEAALADSCAGARRAWSAIGIDDADFCAYLGARAPADAAATDVLGKLRSDELFLCCGCARGDREALRAFDERFLARVNELVAHLRLAPNSVDEACQQLRIKLLSPSDDAPPRIAQFRGQGSLEGWVRVAAVRTALTLTAAERAPGPRESLGGRLVGRAADPELDCLHARYRGVFASALRLSVRELDASDRAVLRFRYLDGLTPEHIGGIYGVHRTTIMRRVTTALAQVLAQTRARVIGQLGVSESECDSLIELVRPQLPLTLSSIFGSDHA